jgi:hypothetical protein
MAGTNEILVGDLVWRNADPSRRPNFTPATPAMGWTWVYDGTTNPYWVWRYNEVRTEPLTLLELMGRLLGGTKSIAGV